MLKISIDYHLFLNQIRLTANNMLCILIVVFIHLNRSPIVRAVVYSVGFRTGLLIHSFDKLENLVF